MKRILSVWLMTVVVWSGYGQLTFYGSPEPQDSLNSPSSENYLSLDWQNQRLFFTRVKHAENVAAAQDEGDVWLSSFTTEWSEEEPLAFNTRDFSAPAGLMPGQDLFLYHQVRYDKGLYYGSVRAVPNDLKGESFELEIPYLVNRSPLQTGNLSADGRFLMLSMENQQGYGVDDLFVCELQSDGTWSGPKNLGRVINTAFQEISPFLAADNKTLIFASNGHGGEGSFDLFQSTRLDDTWQQWSEPVNLGTTVNSEGAETSLVFGPDDEWAYFVSTQNSNGYGDIKRIRIKAELEKVASQEQVQLAITSEEEAALVFKITDKKTAQSLQGQAVIVGAQHQLFDADANGLVEVQAGEGPLVVEFKSPGYFSKTIHVNSEMWDMTAPVEVQLEPLETGATITLDHVLFYRGTANFVEGSEEQLDLVVEMLTDNPDVTIFLKGHTDNVGNATLNVHLSQERVYAVQEYLIRNGISKDRIDGKGYGGAQPIASNADEATRKLNRRVEFEVRRDD
ncbi:OmpA family protein [Marinoscillum furvescens]|uniref:WD40 repeat protein n=1 Tax=Marinoscillum furvescens DSM 4134 TaxID=1122208 RepID=A0A3D9L146_MARFU|nr:OmpA family protein [Marinoscillum furvescens]RED97020.1 WD40 repeat protein [Marinoscillum furvescens DSM 4134]